MQNLKFKLVSLTLLLVKYPNVFSFLMKNFTQSNQLRFLFIPYHKIYLNKKCEHLIFKLDKIYDRTCIFLCRWDKYSSKGEI